MLSCMAMRNCSSSGKDSKWSGRASSQDASAGFCSFSRRRPEMALETPVPNFVPFYRPCLAAREAAPVSV